MSDLPSVPGLPEMEVYQAFMAIARVFFASHAAHVPNIKVDRGTLPNGEPADHVIVTVAREPTIDLLIVPAGALPT